MHRFNAAERATIASEALDVLAAVTTTRVGVGRREAIASLVFELELSLVHANPKSPLRWLAAERGRATPQEISNMVFAAAHAITVRVARDSTDEMAAVAQHFRMVQAHVEHALLYATPAGSAVRHLRKAHGA